VRRFIPFLLGQQPTLLFLIQLNVFKRFNERAFSNAGTPVIPIRTDLFA
jgi:hypothetical protein